MIGIGRNQVVRFGPSSRFLDLSEFLSVYSVLAMDLTEYYKKKYLVYSVLGFEGFFL